MNIAILSVSEKGKILSSKLKMLLDKNPTIINVDTFHKNVKENINNIFNNNYTIIIGIMATGILVRSIALKIQNKTSDPGILSIDDNGKFVISLLSGHLGGANELTLKIAELLKSNPVITTATDINNKIGIDSLSNKYYWEIINKKEILNFNKRILEGKSIKLFLNFNKNEKIRYIDDLKNYLKNNNNNTLEIIDLKNIESSIENIENSILSSNYDEIYCKNENCSIVATFSNEYIFFNPKKIVLGIGSRANISKKDVLKAIKISINNLNIPLERVDSIVTGKMKKNEKGILNAVNEINKPLEIIPIDEIKEFDYPFISRSEFVKEKFDIPGVAEPSALIFASKHGNNPKLIHKKIAVNGVTIAIAVTN